jgi:hypothetical protein
VSRSSRQQLRARLDALDALALDLIQCGACSPARLAAAFERLRRALAEDHRGQQEELAAMTRLCATCDDGISLALAVRAFVSDVRLDLDAEDRRQLSKRRAPAPARAPELRSAAPKRRPG